MANISAGKTKAQVDSRREMYRGKQENFGRRHLLFLSRILALHTVHRVIFNVNYVCVSRFKCDRVGVNIAKQWHIQGAGGRA